MSEQELHNEIMKRLDSIDSKLNPVYEAYMAWGVLRNWGKGILWVTGAVLGAVLALKEIFKK